jgi:hypothetical protein
VWKTWTLHGSCFPTHLEDLEGKVLLLVKVATTNELSAFGGTCSTTTEMPREELKRYAKRHANK